MALKLARQIDSSIAFSEYPLRVKLNNEIHARPAFDICDDTEISQLVFIPSDLGKDELRSYLEKLLPKDAMRHKSANYPNIPVGADVSAHIEEHGEFFVLKVVKVKSQGEPFEINPVAYLPSNWLQNVPGEVISASVASVKSDKSPWAGIDFVESIFCDPSASSVIRNQAEVWMDFQIDDDRFSRTLIFNKCLTAPVMGRLLQRLQEMDIYVMMSLLAVPVVQANGDNLHELEGHVAGLSEKVTAAGNLDSQTEVLHFLTKASDRIEHIAAVTSLRLEASFAYFQAVNRRIADLVEERIKGRRTLVLTLNRRVLPAMDNCRSFNDRLERLSNRVQRMVTILRGQIELETAKHNRDLLVAMNTRSSLQLKVQKVVEGLSCVAIAYYSVGLIEYLAHGFGFTQDLGFVKAIATVVCLVLFPIGLWYFQNLTTKPKK